MNDYTACVQYWCPRRLHCGRYRMEWTEWKSVISPDASSCQHYWPLTDGVPYRLDEPMDCDDRALGVLERGS